MLALTYSLADQNFLTTKSVGIFNLSLHLIQSLAEPAGDLDLAVLSNSTLKDRLKLPASVAVKVHDEAIGGRLRRILWDQSGVYGAAKTQKKPWLFLPKGIASFLRNCPVNLAVYVHDAILESYYKNHRGVSALERLYFQLCLGASLERAQVIFTNSDFTCRELNHAAARRGLRAPPTVNVGIGFQIPSAIAEATDQIVVLVGVAPHKRTELALDYLAKWQRGTKHSGTVVWVGRLPVTSSMPAFPNWSHHGRLPQTDFEDVMERSRVLVFFSDYEGFGMPPVEGVMRGLCPVYSDIAATREVMAGAGCAFQNDSYESFERALNTALIIPPSQIDTWRRSLAGRFNWPKVRSRIVETLRSTELQ